MFFRQVSGTALVTLVGLILTAVLGVLLARELGPEAYGQYAFVISVATIMSLPILAGLPTLIVKEVASLLAIEDVTQFQKFCFFVFGVLMAGAILIAVAFIVYDYLISPEALFGVASIVISLIFLINFEQVLSAFLRGRGRVVSALTPKNIIRPIFLISVIYVLVASDVDISAHNVLFANVVALAFVCFILFIRVKNAFPFQVLIRPVKAEASKWFLSLLPLTVYGGAAAANNEVITVFLGSLTAVSNVGIYKVAMAVTGLASIGLSVVNLVMASRFSEAFALDDSAEIRRLIVQGGGLAMLGTLGISLVVLSFGAELVALIFGSEYLGATLLIQIALVGEVFNVAAGSPALLLNMAGKASVTAKGMIVALIVTVCLSFILIPTYDAVGAAIAFAVSMVTWNVWLAVMVYKELGLHSSPFLCWMDTASD